MLTIERHIILLHVVVHAFPNDVCVIVCVCATLSVNATAECVKAVREHQVPKIDTPHGKENKERERERVGIHIYERKSPDSGTVMMINYRLEITVKRQANTNTHLLQLIQVYSHANKLNALWSFGKASLEKGQMPRH